MVGDRNPGAAGESGGAGESGAASGGRDNAGTFDNGGNGSSNVDDGSQAGGLNAKNGGSSEAPGHKKKLSLGEKIKAKIRRSS